MKKDRKYEKERGEKSQERIEIPREEERS